MTNLEAKTAVVSASRISNEFGHSDPAGFVYKCPQNLREIWRIYSTGAVKAMRSRSASGWKIPSTT